MIQKLSPNKRYFICRYFRLLLLFFLLPFIYPIIRNSISQMFIYGLLILEFLIFIALLIRWLDLRCTEWKIDDEQIILSWGIIARHSEYIELYRINDYSEYSSVTERLFSLKNICISSTDKSTPKLIIFGIDRSIDVLTDLRKKVETIKLKHRIYEVSNY